MKASSARTSAPPNRTATSTAFGSPSTTGTTTFSTRRSPDPEASTGLPSSCRPSMNTLPSRSSSAWSKYVPASSIPTVSPGRASPSPPESTRAIP
ncbi:hypothetical protein [Streptomyces sp. S.PB5]|uniref:hypothetical protein n=1 Tax=Streptomyces sp. S.PB5 TaxID=3020844 RepID=UPI0025B0C733|nr:hypothetical protein [Streptomyces sp. S.PB5]MDN3022142.1 hypothetical protein [Streptomyces sp. S.PB5]